MSETTGVAIVASPVVGSVEKKLTKKTAKKPTTAPSHPSTQQMVDASIKSLKERGGSSLLAIKKYISATYKCDAQKLAPFIKKYLKSSVASGKLIQTKGKGASGSFKLSAAANKEPKQQKIKTIEKNKVTKAAPKKKLTAVKKVVTEEKKNKKPVATKKTAEKKKVEKSKIKNIKKVGTVKTKAVKSTKTTPASASKVTKVKAAPAKKPVNAPKKTAKKPAAKK